MKFLALFFLVGIALTSAVPDHSSELRLDEVEELDGLLSNFFMESEDEDTSSELAKQLRRRLDELLEKIRDSVEKGKEMKEEYLHKLQEIHEQMRDLKVDIGKKAKELVQNLKDKAKDYWKKIWDRISKGDSEEKRSVQHGMVDRLTEAYEKALKTIKDCAENGKMNEKLAKWLASIRNKLKALDVNVDQIAIDYMDGMSDEGKEAFREILIKVGIIESPTLLADEWKDSKVDRLKEAFEKALKTIKRRIDNKEFIYEGLATWLGNILNKLKALNVNVDQIAIDYMDGMSDDGKEAFREILIKVGIIENPTLLADEWKEKVIDRLKEAFEKALKKITQVCIENKQKNYEGLAKWLASIRDKLKALNVDLDQKAIDLIEEISEEGKEAYREILTKVGIIKSSPLVGEERKRSIVDRLKEAFEKALQTIKDRVENGKVVNEGLLERLRNIREKLKGRTGNFDQKARDFLDNISDKGKGAYREILEKLGILKSSPLHSEESDLSQTLREKFEEIIRKIKDAVENQESFRGALEKLKEVREKMRELKLELGEKGRELFKELKEKVKDYLHKIMEKFSDKRAAEKNLNGEVSRSVKDVYEKIKNFFKEMQIDMREKFVEFGRWAKEKYERGLERGRNRVETLRNLAREFVTETKWITNDVAEQARDFFREHKDDLGRVYEEVREKVQKILSRN